MPDSQLTCWTVIQAAASGDSDKRQEFALKYEPVVRAYLSARWRNSALAQDLEEASQETFVEFFRRGGPLERVDRSRGGGFRPFLYGVVRNVARRFEQRRTLPLGAAPAQGEDAAMPADVTADEPTLSFIFDKAWAQAILREAAQRQAVSAEQRGAEAVRRVELLRLRFQEGLEVRDIAARWSVAAEQLHRQYAKARGEFQAALFETVGFHRPGATDAEIEQECVGLLAFFSPRRT